MATDHAAASQTHFARRATGFVRDVKVSDAVIFNVLPACPGLVMAVSIFWVLTAFSGVNVYACIVITAICSFLISGAFGLLSQIMPRSGADYILISRSLHPALAVGSSILIGASSMLAMGYWGVFTAKITSTLRDSRSLTISASRSFLPPALRTSMAMFSPSV